MSDQSNSEAYAATRDALNAKRHEILALRREMRTMQAGITPQKIEDYAFETGDGERPMSSFFGAHNDLIVIHNMGGGCSYCTLWADGFNGVYDHLASRAGFVVTSPDAPEAQKKLAAKRGWRFPMASVKNSSFPLDMGYQNQEFGHTPGVSAFQRRDGALYRVSDTPLGPGDDFAGIWHLFDLFPEGANGWNPTPG